MERNPIKGGTFTSLTTTSMLNKPTNRKLSSKKSVCGVGEKRSSSQVQLERSVVGGVLVFCPRVIFPRLSAAYSCSLVAESTKKKPNKDFKDLLVHPLRRVATPLGPESCVVLATLTAPVGSYNCLRDLSDPEESLYCLRDLLSLKVFDSPCLYLPQSK